ncbi:light-harvesting complex-like protein OHP1, chloroplastic [Bidens hawaiensis]|uniref:light-harvesting complex-like protein OHP1, chloroplastic n=1 Tax=Bidens hawaiensis TaxID=980011 RepID=UPI00404AC113
MATISSSFLQTPNLQSPNLFKPHQIPTKKSISFKIQAAKLPAGVELPKSQPKFQAPFLGFTKTAEVWNSRACMIGLIGTFIVELILNKGILEIIGVEIGKGLDIPL